jgi:hypothetical protein
MDLPQFLLLLKQYGPLVAVMVFFLYWFTKRIDGLLDRNAQIYDLSYPAPLGDSATPTCGGAWLAGIIAGRTNGGRLEKGRNGAGNGSEA